jgi:hypothetical protein
LHGLEGSRNRAGAQVHILRIRLDLGHEPELINVEVSQTLSQDERGLASFIGEFSELAWCPLPISRM